MSHCPALDLTLSPHCGPHPQILILHHHTMMSPLYLLLLAVGFFGVAVDVTGTFPSRNTTLHSNRLADAATNNTFLPQTTRGGWINPEDLAPMPQCIAQQDQAIWISALTKCTSRRCTSHFGAICTHHQWLTQLSCLSLAFSPDVVKRYSSYCGRSILAKAQLYQWIHTITGRTWLVDVGDANDLLNLSPASLPEGYAPVNVIETAPKCLTGSGSDLSTEPFQHVLASCSFTSTAQHTGNAARPWEYSQSLRSMISLDTETAGYDLVPHSIFSRLFELWHFIPDGNYFDKDCFCSVFTIDIQADHCLGSGQLDVTKELLWMSATCGSTSLPDNWTDMLKSTQFAYIPIEDWHWPKCVTDMPPQVVKLADQCETDACEPDSNGYCKVRRAVDRACVCRDISYSSCGGSCQVFDTRIDYVKWLHDLCGNMPDWEGLPDNWRQLAAPTIFEMIPWKWTLKPSINPDPAYMTPLAYTKATETCASNEWKLGSLALVNIATFLAAALTLKIAIRRTIRGSLWHLHPWSWALKGTWIAAFQLLGNWFNALLVQSTLGYEDVPLTELILFWCSMPRLAWLAVLLIGVHPLATATSFLFAEIILQILSFYYIATTVIYGGKHNFYLGGLGGAEREQSAKAMYAGALIWLIVVGIMLVQSVRAARKMNKFPGSGQLTPPWKVTEGLVASVNQNWTNLSKPLAQYWMDGIRSSETTPLTTTEGEFYPVYGTFSANVQPPRPSENAFVEFYATVVLNMLLLSLAQWVFWFGFIGLSSEEYVFVPIQYWVRWLMKLRFCLPKLLVLTTVWACCSLAGTAVVDVI